MNLLILTSVNIGLKSDHYTCTDCLCYYFQQPKMTSQSHARLNENNKNK